MNYEPFFDRLLAALEDAFGSPDKRIWHGSTNGGFAVFHPRGGKIIVTLGRNFGGFHVEAVGGGTEWKEWLGAPRDTKEYARGIIEEFG